MPGGCLGRFTEKSLGLKSVRGCVEACHVDRVFERPTAEGAALALGAESVLLDFSKIMSVKKTKHLMEDCVTNPVMKNITSK